MIDNEPVNIGDSVYVLGIGSGVVESINADGGFSVRTGGGTTFYRDGGYIGNQRRVYWSDPCIINPPKDSVFWQSFISVATTIYEQLKNFRRRGV